MMIKVKIFLVTNSNHDVHHELPIDYRLSPGCVHLGNHLSPEMIFFTLNIMVIIGVHDCTPIDYQLITDCLKKVYISRENYGDCNSDCDVHDCLPIVSKMYTFLGKNYGDHSVHQLIINCLPIVSRESVYF